MPLAAGSIPNFAERAATEFVGHRFLNRTGLRKISSFEF
jgi:hypothetical protein